MTFNEASKIVKIWGVFLEFASGKLLTFFGAHIPESFLPFPKETIEKALNVLAEYHHNIGNQDEVKLLQSSIGALLLYVDDEEAVLNTVKRFEDVKLREAVLLALKKFQNDWIKTQGDS